MKKIYQTKWWEKHFKKEVKSKEPSTLENIESISEFLDDVHHEIDTVKSSLKELKELEKEREVATEGLIKVNLSTQAEIIDKILTQYEFFQNDTDINGIRIKRIAKTFLENSKKAGLNDLVKQKSIDKKWQGW